MYTAAKTYPGAYSQKIRANVCNSQFGHSQIGPTGAIVVSAGGCKGSYDAFNGSALAWCAACFAPTAATGVPCLTAWPPVAFYHGGRCTSAVATLASTEIFLR